MTQLKAFRGTVSKEGGFEVSSKFVKVSEKMIQGKSTGLLTINEIVRPR